MRACEEMKYVLFFSEAKPDPDSLGGKGANLVKLAKLGANVPPGFIITSSAYVKFLWESKNKTRFEELLSKDLQPSEVINFSRSMAGLILETGFPKDVENEVRTAFSRIRRECGTKASFAVRSSATIEDTDTFSFAGQGQTYLNNGSFGEVLSSVRNCWASLFSFQALSYFLQMRKLGKKHLLSDVRMAVVVQEMIDSEVSGVLFTANVMNNNREQIMINSTWGLGETIANNSVTPDMIILDKTNFKILRSDVGEKKKISVKNPKGLGTVMLDTDRGLRTKLSLNESQLLELFHVGLWVENALDYPQDIEWAIRNGKVYILQSRPITTLES
jgi:pyruvate,water dikinase